MIERQGKVIQSQGKLKGHRKKPFTLSTTVIWASADLF